MIIIVNGKVFIDGKEILDPTLIGYAVLDFAESQEITSKENFVGEQVEIINYEKFLEENSLLDTHERKILFNILSNMCDSFNPSDFIKKVLDFNITNSTGYNFLKTMTETGYLKMNPKTYSFESKCLVIKIK